MKQFFGSNAAGNLKDAVSGLNNPAVILLMSNADQFEQHVAELESIFPGVPSIGCVGMSYDTKIVEKGVSVTAYSDGVTAAANVIEEASVKPVKYIKRLEDDVKKVKPGKENTVCIDYCTGNDACVLATISPVLNKNHVGLMGGTGDAGKVSVNGKIYEDAMVYALIKNETGKAKVYKENIYKPMIGDYRFIASKTDRAKYYVGEFNGKPAKQVYMDACGINDEKAVETQTFKNPLGKFVGKDVCIVSIKQVTGNGLECFRQVNDSDVLTLLELKDYNQVAQDTIASINADFKSISGIYSVNCLFRYLLFTENGNMKDYLDVMSCGGAHCGFVGYGEHYNAQFVNQSMTCAVFE